MSYSDRAFVQLNSSPSFISVWRADTRANDADNGHLSANFQNNACVFGVCVGPPVLRVRSLSGRKARTAMRPHCLLRIVCARAVPNGAVHAQPSQRAVRPRVLPAALQRQGSLPRNGRQHELRLQQRLRRPFLHAQNMSQSACLHRCAVPRSRRASQSLILFVFVCRIAQDMAVARRFRESAIAKRVFTKTTAASAAAPMRAGLICIAALRFAHVALSMRSPPFFSQWQR
jgi:hypothetical protein